jgi:hypothetical protein
LGGGQLALIPFPIPLAGWNFQGKKSLPRNHYRWQVKVID